MNKFNVLIAVTDPDSFKTVVYPQTIYTDKINPDYEHFVNMFFKKWDKPDKYDKGYAIGCIKIQKDDN